MFERQGLSRRMDAKTIDPSYLQDEPQADERNRRGLTDSGPRMISCLHNCGEIERLG